MTRFPVVTAVANVLTHAPGLVRYGSKPLRDLAADPALAGAIGARLRSYEAAVAYAPNQTYIGNRDPETLRALPRPWFAAPDPGAAADGAFGDFLDEVELLGLLKLNDRARLVQLDAPTLAAAGERLARRGLVTSSELGELAPATEGAIAKPIESGDAIPLWLDGRVAGSMARGHEQDEALTANVLLENLVAKSTGMLALRRLLRSVAPRLGADGIEFVIAGSEEAVGDRYQRGGGNLAKAIAEAAGVGRATGFDVKSFCASTLYAVFNAAALIQAGVFSRVAVVAGGSLAKLGMKYRAHLAKEMPILEDVLAGIAVLVERDTGADPCIRLDTLGMHTVATGSSQQAVVEALVMGPLAKAGYRLRDVDRYATEMHNPEVTEPAGSGDVPAGNYRLIAALGALRGEIARDAIPDFITTHGIPGYAPTQGHIASAVCYLAHALRAMRAGKMKRALFMAKGSLFLGRMTESADGVSFLVEA
ncbi:MAG TPA: glycine/sarcosine/betaine reductase complex component C subunit beta [Methylomirabilota bacterium]|jgi:betaine reductase|nr:glycine/sarcosine/betaine reductase complex component C subunit beta [Methylomirabilota bacterium]